MKKRPIQYFLLKVALLFLIVFALDFTIGSILKFFYFRLDSGQLYRTTYSIEKSNSDLLVFGSSRANHHYHPEIFVKGLNMSYYNEGRDGSFIFYHYAVLKCNLRRYSPKAVILDILYDEFSKKSDSYDRISALLPYYQKHPEIKSIIKLRGKYEEYKLLSKIYPYNSMIFKIVMGNIELFRTNEVDNSGYLPLNGILETDAITDTTSFKVELDSTMVKVFESFINECIHSGVELFVVCSPYLVKSNKLDKSLKIAEDLCNKNNIPFFDFSVDSVFLKSPKYFVDPLHLNDDGAKTFSNMLMDKISICRSLKTENNNLVLF